ncbi:unnamed protein product [Rhizophagus irregularis]|nr:unnamed protein product [Rhizophagus irregularis]
MQDDTIMLNSFINFAKLQFYFQHYFELKEGRKLDKKRFTTIHVHKKFNVPNWGRDKSLITRNIQFNKRKANAQSKKKI